MIITPYQVVVLNICRCTLYILHMNSVDWNDGMEQWIGLLEWSTGLDHWSATPTILARSFLATTKLDHSSYARYGVKISSRTGTRLGLARHNIFFLDITLLQCLLYYDHSCRTAVHFDGDGAGVVQVVTP